VKVALNNLTDVPKHLCEVESTVCVTSGFDRPKYTYLKSGRGGDLGFDEWTKPSNSDFATGSDVYGIGTSYENAAGDSAHYGGAGSWSKKVVGAGASGGSLTLGNWYCAVLVAVNENLPDVADFQISQPTVPSVPVLAQGSNLKITWQLPIHEQKGIVAAGSHTGSDGASALTDSQQSWATNELSGTIYNLTDGSSGTITANTADTVTATLSGGTDNDWDEGDEYQILADECTKRYLYVAEADTSEGAWASSNFYFQGEINDNSTTSYTQDTMVLTSDTANFTSDTANFDRLRPPAGVRFCTAFKNKAWFTGGVYETQSTAKYLTTQVTYTSNAVEFARETYDYFTTYYTGSDDTSSSANTLTDSNRSWNTNELAGYTCFNITDGTSDTIASNTATVVTFDNPGTITWDSGDNYQIVDYTGDDAGYGIICRMKITGQTATGIYRGSRLTVENPTTGTNPDANNLVSDVKVLRVCNDGSDTYVWFRNDDLVVESSVDADVTVDPNVSEGYTAGSTDTRWGEGMIGAEFSHDDSNAAPAVIEWVDREDQRIG